MRNFVVMSVVIAGGLLAGCQGNAPRVWSEAESNFLRTMAKPQACAEPICQIAVDVSAACPPSTALPRLELTGPNGERELEWNIAGTSWEFSREHWKFAIYFRGNTLGNRVQSASIVNAGKGLKVKFRRMADGEDFEYKLNLRNASTNAWCEIDPWIVDAL